MIDFLCVFVFAFVLLFVTVLAFVFVFKALETGDVKWDGRVAAADRGHL